MSQTESRSSNACAGREIPAIIYAAKSSPQENDESTGAQIARCRERVAREPDRVLHSEPFSEENVSAYKGNRGPELEAAIQAATEAAEEYGQAELWVWKSNRLARGSGRKREARSLLELFTDMRRRGVTLRSVTDDEYLREEFVGMASRMANKFGDDLAVDVQRGKRRAFEDGQHSGGPCWDGYRDVPMRDAQGEPVVTRRGRVEMRRVINPEREPVIRRLWGLLLDGIADASVARTLNGEGLRTADGGAWSRRRVQDTRTNPAYAGAVVWHRGRPDQEFNWEGRHEGTYLSRAEWEHVQMLCASRDQSASGRPKGGRPTTRYALAKLARCNCCGERMYASTSAYKRKDGVRRRRYICKNLHGSTGECNAAPIDAERVDLAVISHLDSLFIDFDAWIAELDRGTQTKRAALQSAIEAAMAKLDALNQRTEKIEADYLKQLDAGNNRAADFASRMLDRTADERLEVERQIEAHRIVLEELDQPSTDAMLDVFNALRDAIRGAAADQTDGLGALNDRLRGIFEAFWLEVVDDGVIGIVPVLRADVVERYGSDDLTMVSGDVAIASENSSSAAIPVALFATGDEPVRPPGKPLQVPLVETGNRTHE